MIVSEEQKMREYRMILDLLNKKPRIHYSEVSEILGMDARTVSSRMKEAFKRGIIVGPQIRKKSFSNLKSYMYLLDCDNPTRTFEEFVKDKSISYHAFLDGFCNILAISDRKLDIEGALLWGVTADYYVSHASDQSWRTTINNMWTAVGDFNPQDYTPTGHITTHWNETVEWSEEHEILYQEFKYNLRKPLRPIVSGKYNMWRGKAYDFLEQLPQCCTIFTYFYPEALPTYNHRLYLFETEYEDFIIDLFSQLPTTCWFQRISGKLIGHISLLTNSIGQENTRIRDVTALQIPLLVKELVRKGIVKSETHANFECYWRKEVDEIEAE
ncbi:MAG: winged helix-turn-helix domain-containing protein [Candidatus Methanofastidiosia archaeon]